MINELLSETSRREEVAPEYQVIDVKVKNNKIQMPDDLSDFDSSSHSSPKNKNKMIRFKKRQNQKIIPSQRP